MKKNERRKMALAVLLLVGLMVQIIFLFGLKLGIEHGQDMPQIQNSDAVQGSVTIYAEDGTVWGYIGNMKMISYSNGQKVDIELYDAWMIGPVIQVSTIE